MSLCRQDLFLLNVSFYSEESQYLQRTNILLSLKLNVCIINAWALKQISKSGSKDIIFISNQDLTGEPLSDLLPQTQPHPILQLRSGLQMNVGEYVPQGEDNLLPL